MVVPGESRGTLRVAQRLLFAILLLCKRMRHTKTGVSTSFASSMLMASFVAWMLLLLASFGLIAHGLENWFSPPADSFEQAAFIAGSSLAPSAIEAYGPAHRVLVAAGICGLAVLTMAVTYFDQGTGGNFPADRGVLKITTTSGQPPSALGMCERYADLDAPVEIRRVLYDGRDCALLSCRATLPPHSIEALRRGV